MPDFIATLASAITFCLGLAILNQLTPVVLPFAPFEFDQNGLLQIGGALLLARLACRYRRPAKTVAIPIDRAPR